MSYLLCNSGYKKIEHIGLFDFDKLLKYAFSQELFNNIFLIAPTGKIVRLWKQKAVKAYFNSFGKPAPDFNIFTLQGFAGLCFSKLFGGSGYNLISDAFRLALVEEASESAEMTLFKKNSQRLSPVILRKLSDIIYGLKEDGITLDNLEKDIILYEHGASGIKDIKRIKDIYILYREYQKLLGTRFLDFPELLFRLNIGLKQILSDAPPQSDEGVLAFKTFFSENKIILFFGFSEFKSPEIEFIKHLAKTESAVAVNLDYSNINGPLFSNLKEIIPKFCEDAFEPIILNEYETNEDKRSAHDEFDANPSVYLRRWLFNTDEQVVNPRFSDFIRIISADSRLDEVKTIAKIIKRLAVRENVKLKDICVAMRQPGLYADLFREVFRQYNIPVNITDRHILSDSPPVTAAFAFLDVINYGYKREDVNRALQSGWAENIKNNGVTIDGGNLFDTALKLKIQGGRRNFGLKRWTARLEGYIKILENRLFTLKNNASPEAMEIRSVEVDLKKCKKALDDFIILSDLFKYKSEKEKLTPLEFQAFVKNDIINQLDFRGIIEDQYSELKNRRNKLENDEYLRQLEFIEKDSRALTAFVDVLEEMTFILSERYKGDKRTIEEYTDRLKTAAKAAKYQIREKSNYGVTITSIEQTRDIPYAYMFLCGAIDGEFPMAYNTEALLGKELDETERRHFNAEMMQFYKFLTNSPDLLDSGKNRLYITYPKNVEIGECVRSLFVDALLKITSLENDNCLLDLQEMRNTMSLSGTLLSKEYEWLDCIAGKSELMALAGESLKDGAVDDDFPDTFGIVQAAANYKKWTDTSNYISDFFKLPADLSNGCVNIELLSREQSAILKNKVDQPVSISELETYKSCPYKYYAQRILNLEEKPTEEIGLSPIEKGSLLHLILYKFYSSLQTAGAGLSQVWLKAENKSDYSIALRKIADEEINFIKFDHPFFELQKSALLEKLEVWLNAELEKVSNSWTFAPAAFELSFGIKRDKRYGSAIKSIPEITLSDKLKLKGKIDRLELNDEDKQYLIADYKTTLNNIPGNNEIFKGIKFQMPLYIAAARKILLNEFGIDYSPSGGVYYALESNFDKKKRKFEYHRFVMIPQEINLPKPDKRSKSIVLDSYAILEDMIVNSISFAEQALEDISKGKFDVKPLDSNVCKYCSFDAVCQIKSRNLNDFAEENGSILDE